MNTQETSNQLALLETPEGWRLDHQTRELGRKGVAEARRALQLAGRQAESEPAQAA